MAQLVAMDFDPELAEMAAHATAGDLAGAVEYCLSHPSRAEMAAILNEPELLAADAAAVQEQRGRTFAAAAAEAGSAQPQVGGRAGAQEGQAQWQEARTRTRTALWG